jgi:hypothetical protein
MSEHHSTSVRPSLWFAFFAGPLAWTAHETVSYALVKPACSAHLIVLEALVSAAALALTVFGGYLAYRSVARSVPRNAPEFIAASALVLNLLFAFAILLESLPELVVNPCL